MIEFKRKYFDSSIEFQKKNILHVLKSVIFSSDNSTKHYSLILLNRWKYFKNSKKILDIGCGLGEFMKLNPYKKDIQGTDIIDETVEKLQKEGFKVKKGGDLRYKLPYKDEEFDSVYMSHVLEHLDNPTHAVEEIKRILKPEGMVMMVTPNFSYKKFYGDYTHKRPFPKMALYRLMRDNGFVNVKILNGHCHSKIISSITYPFPKLRYKIEKFFGKMFPSEFITLARKAKN